VVAVGADPRARHVGGVVGATLERCEAEVGRGSSSRGGTKSDEAVTEVESSTTRAAEADSGVAEVEEAPDGGEGGRQRPEGMAEMEDPGAKRRGGGEGGRFGRGVEAAVRLQCSGEERIPRNGGSGSRCCKIGEGMQ
jgi:hypothetical protein